MSHLINGLIITVSVCLFSCDNSSSEVDCPPRPFLNDGEIVVYEITYPDNTSVSHRFEEIADNKDSANTYYSNSNGETATFNLQHSCEQVTYSTPVSFLFYGCNLTEPEQLPAGQDAQAAPVFYNGGCQHVALDLSFGTINAKACLSSTTDNTIQHTYYTHAEEVDDIPLRGLLRYEYKIGDQRYSAELIEWNGL